LINLLQLFAVADIQIANPFVMELTGKSAGQAKNERIDNLEKLMITRDKKSQYMMIVEFAPMLVFVLTDFPKYSGWE